MPEDTIYTKEELAEAEAAGLIQPDLPPPGDARREVLAQRADELVEKAEKHYENRGSIPPHLLEEDREIQHDIHEGYLEIGKNHPHLKTAWVNFVNVHGQKPWQYKSKGWRVATLREFPEAKGLESPEGYIKVGDTMLMFISKERYLEIERANHEKMMKQQFGLDSRIHEIAAKHPGKFVVHDEAPGHVTQRMGAMANSARRNAAARSALNHIGNKMKEGEIPGLPIK